MFDVHSLQTLVRLEMVHQNSMRFQNTICYDEHYNGLVLDEKEGDRLAEIMKDNKQVVRSLVLPSSRLTICTA